MGVLSWVFFGLIAGAIAKYLIPSQAPGGCFATIALGIIGALVGGFIGTKLGVGDISGFNLHSMLLAIGGGVVVLFIFGVISKNRM